MTNTVVGEEGQSREYDVRCLANWVLDRSEKEFNTLLTNMAINKIVFFIYEAMLLKWDRVITPAKFEAWEHGPVVREIYHSFKSFGDKGISSRVKWFDIDSRSFADAYCLLDDQDERKFIEIVDELIPLSASTLRNISHIPSGAWYSVWMHDSEANPGMEISPSVIRSTNSRHVRT